MPVNKIRSQKGDAPATLAVAVTPSDATDLTVNSRFIYVGGAGNLSVIMADDPVGTAVTFTALAVGVFHPLAVRRVMSTNTTNTLIRSLS